MQLHFIMADKVIYYLQYVWFSIKLNFVQRNVFFIDLDNTLADTWPDRLDMKTFKWANVKPQPKILEFVYQEIANNAYYPIVLSARPITAYIDTLQWVKKHTNLPAQNIFFVKKAIDKQKYFEIVLKKDKMGAVIDDCSHGHEHGEVQYYDALIKYICTHKIHYYDFEFIKQIAKK